MGAPKVSFFDYIPFISSFKGLGQLGARVIRYASETQGVQKIAKAAQAISGAAQEEVVPTQTKSHRWALSPGSKGRELTILVPIIGNLAVLAFDLWAKRKIRLELLERGKISDQYYQDFSKDTMFKKYENNEIDINQLFNHVNGKYSKNNILVDETTRFYLLNPYAVMKLAECYEKEAEKIAQKDRDKEKENLPTAANLYLLALKNFQYLGETVQETKCQEAANKIAEKFTSNLFAFPENFKPRFPQSGFPF